ncbi:MAG: universal stress protein [Myxococcales bacterium]|nr:universal stress protein [Myxococcales bacterium]MCB9732561.1 universal stress protein [Deltaproteobacteria bacterium]
MTVPYPFRKILVPTDFSTCSDSALTLGAQLAHDVGAELVALHVVDPGHVPLSAVIHPSTHPEGVDVRTHTTELATRAIERRLERLPVTVVARSGHVVFGRPAKMICQAVADLGADLVVMGTHGRTGIAHLIMGSVAEKVLRVAKVPVLTVREATCVDRPLDPELSFEDEG